MEIILETPRLILRKFELSDAQFFFELNSNPMVTKYTGDGAFKTVEESEERIQFVLNQYKDNGYGRWLVAEKDTQNPLGWCGLKFHPEENETDLGYRFMEKYWGKGYATESSKACMDYGFSILKLDRIIGNVANDNIASITVLKKMGMTYLNETDIESLPSSTYQVFKKDYK